MKKTIQLTEIDLQHSPRSRSEIREDVVQDYVESYKAKQAMPEPIVFTYGKKFLIADGLHRFNAMKQLGLTEAMFEVKLGSQSDCVKFAMQANLHHGLRRSNADKRACTETTVKEFTTLSDALLAEIAAVSRDLVADVRKSLETKGEVDKVETRTSADGAQRPARNMRNPQVSKSQPSEPQPHEESTNPVPPAKGAPAKGSEVLDSTGYPVPEQAMALYLRAKEAEEFTERICSIGKDLSYIEASGDILWKEVNFGAALADAENLMNNCKRAIPYAVCPSCQGKLSDKCKLCEGRGMISKLAYDTLVDPKLKEIRGKK